MAVIITQVRNITVLNVIADATQTMMEWLRIMRLKPGKN